MSYTISKSEYCADPSKANQAKLGDPNVIKYYNSICAAQKELSKKTDTNSLSKAIPQALGQFVMGLVEQLPLLGLIYGVSIPVKVGYQIALKTLEKGMSLATKEGTELLIREGIETGAINIAALITTFTSEAFLSIFGGLSFAAKGVLELASFMVELIDVLTWPLLILQITGMIFDAWDPCHLNDQLDAKYLQQLGTQFNEGFRKTAMAAVGAMQTSYGQIYYIDIWPIEYYAEKCILPKYKQKEYDALTTLYVGRYLNALEYNSDGEPISWPTGDGTVVTNDHLSRASRTVSLAAADQNSVVANWLSKYWPILILILILIIVFVVVIK